MFDEFFFKNRYLILSILSGLILISLGFLFFRKVGIPSSTKIEVLNASSESKDTSSELVVEISGAIERPGVYKLTQGSRIDDLLVVSGGLSVSCDRDWVDKNINRAAKLFDGQKLYIPKVGDDLTTSPILSGGGGVEGFISINSSDLKELIKLPEIGLKYAQKIIDHRPYSNTNELVSKGILSQSIYDKIKDLVTLY